MHKFDTYIKSLTGSLSICNKEKEELAAEFRDHLESLKSEYVMNGLSEDDAENKAIESFGESSDIYKKLHSSLSVFRNPATLLFGVIIIIALLLLNYIPVAGVAIAYNDYNHTINNTQFFYDNKLLILCSSLLLIPISYFMPVIFNKTFKLLHLALTYTILGIILGIFMSMIIINTVNLVILLMCLAGALIGGIAGYVTLMAVNNFYTFCRNTNSKRLAG